MCAVGWRRRCDFVHGHRYPRYSTCTCSESNKALELSVLYKCTYAAAYEKVVKLYTFARRTLDYTAFFRGPNRSPGRCARSTGHVRARARAAEVARLRQYAAEIESALGNLQVSAKQQSTSASSDKAELQDAKAQVLALRSELRFVEARVRAACVVVCWGVFCLCC